MLLLLLLFNTKLYLMWLAAYLLPAHGGFDLFYDLQLRKIIQTPDFPSKRNPHLRTKPPEQRRQELEDYIQVWWHGTRSHLYTRYLSTGVHMLAMPGWSWNINIFKVVSRPAGRFILSKGAAWINSQWMNKSSDPVGYRKWPPMPLRLCHLRSTISGYVMPAKS